MASAEGWLSTKELADPKLIAEETHDVCGETCMVCLAGRAARICLAQQAECELEKAAIASLRERIAIAFEVYFDARAAEARVAELERLPAWGVSQP